MLKTELEQEIFELLREQIGESVCLIDRDLLEALEIPLSDELKVFFYICDMLIGSGNLFFTIGDGEMAEECDIEVSKMYEIFNKFNRKGVLCIEAVEAVSNLIIYLNNPTCRAAAQNKKYEEEFSWQKIQSNSKLEDI